MNHINIDFDVNMKFSRYQILKINIFLTYVHKK